MPNLIVKEYLSHKILFTDEGWINATKTAQNFGKDVRGYTRSEQYKGYAKTLSKRLNCDVQDLHIAKKGGDLNEVEQGTFLHPKLAIDFARWISPDFAIWCDEQVANILNQKVFPQSFPEALRLYADQVEKNELLEKQNKKLIDNYNILEDKAFDNWELFRLYLRPTKQEVDRVKKKK